MPVFYYLLLFIPMSIDGHYILPLFYPLKYAEYHLHRSVPDHILRIYRILKVSELAQYHGLLISNHRRF